MTCVFIDKNMSENRKRGLFCSTSLYHVSFPQTLVSFVWYDQYHCFIHRGRRNKERDIDSDEKETSRKIMQEKCERVNYLTWLNLTWSELQRSSICTRCSIIMSRRSKYRLYIPPCHFGMTKVLKLDY